MAADRPAYFNGEHRGLAGLRVPALDHGFLFADGVYELIPVFGRRPRCLDYHLERLADSLAAIGIKGAPDAGRLARGGRRAERAHARGAALRLPAGHPRRDPRPARRSASSSWTGRRRCSA